MKFSAPTSDLDNRKNLERDSVLVTFEANSYTERPFLKGRNFKMKGFNTKLEDLLDQYTH